MKIGRGSINSTLFRILRFVYKKDKLAAWIRIDLRGVLTQMYNFLSWRVSKYVVIWLCGLWAFGLGARFTFELIRSGPGTYVMIPVNLVNILFDFLVLSVLGFLCVVYSVHTLHKIMIIKKVGL